MSNIAESHRSSRIAAALAVVLPAILVAPAFAQPKGAPQAAAASPPAGSIERLSGVWVEGPGFDITYGKSYDVCAHRCLGNPKCAMIEYYRPEKKCNLYDAVRPRKQGGSSDVGIRR